MRVKLLLLFISCALAFAACTTKSTTNHTASAPGQPGAQPPMPGAPVAGATNGAPANAQPAAPASTAANTAPCALLTSDDIKAVQGEEVKETKASQHNEFTFAVAQCFYTTTTFSKSVSLELIQGDQNNKASPRHFWAETFTRAVKQEERERKRAGERKSKEPEHSAHEDHEAEEKEGPPPQHVMGLGDDAYWVNNQVSGALYVLKGDRFIRLSLGGADADAARQRKAQTLAQKVLARL